MDELLSCIHCQSILRELDVTQPTLLSKSVYLLVVPADVSSTDVSSTFHQKRMQQ